MGTMHLPVGTTLQGGKYRIVRFLSSGGFGCTYEAEHTQLQSHVALKEFFPKSYCNRDEQTGAISLGTLGNAELVATFRRKFLDEARVVFKMQHPNIVRVVDIFEEKGTAYYAMDYIDGQSLADVVKQRGKLPEKEAVRYVLQIADALKYVHSQNRLHLDVKPGNIMLDKSDRAILIDFGTCKHYDGKTGEETSQLLGVNTPGYAPVELTTASFKHFSPATDIYSLGATLYKLLTGITPPSATDLMNEEEKLQPLPTSISSPVCNAINASMQLKRKYRPQSIDEWIVMFSASTSVQEESDETEIDAVELLCPKPPKGKKVQPTIMPPPLTPSKHNGRRKVFMILGGIVAVLLLSVCLGLYIYVHHNDILLKTKDDVEVSLNLTRLKAQFGSSEDQCNLGYFYSQGEGVEQDYQKAVKWFRKAAEHENARAQYNLGVCYENGDGVEQDNKEAMKWYKLAADQGYEDAQCNLGGCYYSGAGVEQDYVEAVKWFRKSADQGNATAQYNLGVCYQNGDGVEQDYVEAVKWYRKSADQGDEDAQNNLGVCYQNGYGVEQDYVEAVKWYRKSAEQGDEDAQCNLGCCYYNGAGVEQDYVEAVKWFRKSADQGNVTSQYNLGVCYQNGDGVEQDNKEAIKWYKLAADQGYEDAKKALQSLQ